MEEVISYLDKKNIEYKISGKEVIIKCPNCGKEKLYINTESLVYHCFRCEAKEPENVYAHGHFSKLKELWGDIVPISRLVKQKTDDPDYSIQVERYHKNLLKSSKGMKYIYSRNISDEMIKRFKLGFIHFHNHDWISIPIYEDGIPKNIKYRQIPPENPNIDKYKREKGGKSILFNGDVIEKYNELFIQEGEIDTITLIQNGYENVVGITGGAGTLLPEWQERLRLKEKLYLIFDSDLPGQKAAEKVWATRLGRGKCWNVLLPKEYDVNKFFMSYTKEDFEKLIKEAKRFEVVGVSSIKEVFLQMYEKSQDEDTQEKFALPWKNINKLLNGGFARSRLTVLGGSPGVGKTSMSIQIAYHFAKEYKLPSLVFCLEMSEISLVTKIIQLHYGFTLEEVDYSDALIYQQELKDLPLYFGYSPRIKPSVFYETMKEVRNRYGVEFGIFDNLQRMIRTGEESDMAKASGMFKDITMDLDIPFLLVSQPRKTGGRELIMDDLKGSAAIPADADDIILMYRAKTKSNLSNEVFSPETSIVIPKSRFSQGGKSILTFDGARSRFYEETNI